MQTTISRGYLPPSDVTIQTAAKSAAIKTKASSFVIDVCNLNADGRFMNVDELHTAIEKDLEEKFPIVRSSDKSRPFKRSDNNNTYQRFSEARESFVKDNMELAQKVRHTLSSIPDTAVDGASPMERAINLIKLLEAQQGNSSSDENESELSQLNNLLSRENVSKAAKALSDAQDLSEKEKSLLKDLNDIKNKSNGKSKNNKEGKIKSDGSKGGMSDGTVTTPTGTKGKLVDSAVHLSDRQLAAIISVSRKLKAISKLNTHKVTEFAPDKAGQEVRNKSMTNLDDIARLKGTALAQMVVNKPLFNYRAVTNQFVIRERGNFKERKQLLYVLVDCSGSMRDDGFNRINMAAGVLVNRLMAVASGDAKLFWRFFDTCVHKETFVEDKHQAFDSIEYILKGDNYNGGGTNFDEAIRTSVSHIESISESLDIVKPEIFMVTDGDCACRLSLKDLKGIKLHTAFVASSGGGQQLKKLSTDSGGVVLQLV